MSLMIAIPVIRVGCKVGIDRGRGWSVIEEGVLWAVSRRGKAIRELVDETKLPHQVIVAAIARLMRFRLVEVSLNIENMAFRASEYGFKVVSGGDPLPFFPKRISRRVSFVIERATGDFFPTRQVRLLTRHRMDEARKIGTEFREISIEGGTPSTSHEANLNRLSDIAAHGWDEQIALVDGRTATMRDDEFMVLRVIDGVPQGFPESAGQKFRRVVAEVASLPRGRDKVHVSYDGPVEISETEPTVHACAFNAEDLVIGGSAQRQCLESLLCQAHGRVIVHSTFLDARRFEDIGDLVRAACARGVTFDLLWGAEKDEPTELRNAKAAAEIAKIVRDDPVMNRKFRVHMRTTGSHAKIVLLDTPDGSWIAGVGSCNWLSSPFQAVELTAVLRHPHVVADVAVAVQRLTGRRGLSDEIATEMAITGRDLRRMGSAGGEAQISIVVGEAHDRLIRKASGAATTRFVVGSHRLGSTARPGALMQSEFAAGRGGVQASVLYTYTSGPLKNRHARALAEEARVNGVMLTKTNNPPLHGKFIAWDHDDMVVTSLNWASASSNPDFPWADIGIHLHGRGIATEALRRLDDIFPQLAPAREANSSP